MNLKTRSPLHMATTLATALALGACAGDDPVPARDTGAAPARTTIAAGERKHQLLRRAPLEATALHAPAPAPAPYRERYGHFEDNPVRRASENPVSTFSIDVDTGAYANVRRMLNAGHLPPADAVRVEELINYFDYDYPPPAHRQQPFSVTTEAAPAPWNPHRRLLLIGLRGWAPPPDRLPPANLVFLVDVSGSMQSPDKLPLLKSALALLVRELGPRDRVSIVVYAGASGVVLEPTPGDRKAKILAALESLAAGGPTNGAAGIRLAYRLARQAYMENGINRVILATDGDFNVGITDFHSLLALVKRQRGRGIALTTLGFGRGNYNDHLMEQLADHGDGNHAYIDTLAEARKVLLEQRAGTLLTIARDVKIQVEFNPAVVSEYRLVGYVNRRLRREDFNNDKVDAGDIGAGHTVTALYELTPAGAGRPALDPLRYGPRPPAGGRRDELALVRLRYKLPGETRSRLVERVVKTGEVKPRLADASGRLRFAAAVAGFGQLLRGGRYTGDWSWDDALALARAARGPDPEGWRGEFLGLVRTAAALDAALAGR